MRTATGCAWILGALLCAAAPPNVSVRGKLIPDPAKPVLVVSANERVFLHGDQDTAAVLADKRLAGADLEAAGHFTSPGHFEVAPAYTKNLFVHRAGKRLTITYWCPICSIRTYTPGLCMCCREETHLDLREPEPE